MFTKNELEIIERALRSEIGQVQETRIEAEEDPNWVGPDEDELVHVIVEDSRLLEKIKALRRVGVDGWTEWAKDEGFKGLVQVANLAGAEGIWFIRGAKSPYLIYTPDQQPKPLPIEDTIVHIADTGVLVIIRLPEDGGSHGIESR
jgi:hypothetical protein